MLQNYNDYMNTLMLLICSFHLTMENMTWGSGDFDRYTMLMTDTKSWLFGYYEFRAFIRFSDYVFISKG
jgi:hypothetical protein